MLLFCCAALKLRIDEVEGNDTGDRDFDENPKCVIQDDKAREAIEIRWLSMDVASKEVPW